MVYPNDQGEATTTLYEDDGLSPAYKQGVSRRTTVNVSAASGGYQIRLDAPVGNYQPGARSFVFVVKSTTHARQLMLDGKTLNVTKPDEKGSGWHQETGAIVARIADDGRAHTLLVK
jgi:hypothetical protein